MTQGFGPQRVLEGTKLGDGARTELRKKSATLWGNALQRGRRGDGDLLERLAFVLAINLGIATQEITATRVGQYFVKELHKTRQKHRSRKTTSAAREAKLTALSMFMTEPAGRLPSTSHASRVTMARAILKYL